MVSSNMTIWIVIAGAVAMAVWLFALERGRPERSHKLPRGTAGWPLLGELIPFAFRTHGFIKERREMYGGLFRTSLLGYPTVISTDPAVNKFILDNDSHLFVPHYPTTLLQLLGKWSGLHARGDRHKRFRGACLRFISSSILKHRALSEIENIITSTLSGWEGRTVNVLHEGNEIMFSIMANHLLSIRAGTELETLKSNYFDLRKGFLSLPLKVPGTTFYKSLQVREEMCNLLKHIIEERDKSKNISSDDSYDDLLSSIRKDTAENETDKFEYTNERMADWFVRLMFAAMETTPRVMALAVKRLSENPHIIPKLREEHETIRRSKRNNENLSWDDYKSMSFTKNVIKETMRLGDGRITNIMVRKTNQNVQVEGYTIPKGWTCIVYDGFYSMDSKYYTDPYAFNPDRWQASDMNQAPFIGFGGGPRLCLGNELATLVMSFSLHYLLTKFKWEYKPPGIKAGWFESAFYSKVDCTIRVESL